MVGQLRGADRSTKWPEAGDAAGRRHLHPEATQAQQHWQTAVEMLIKAAEGEPVWLMMARIGMKQALIHGKERVFSDRKEPHWGKRKLKRDQ